MDPFASFGQDRWPWVGERQIRGSGRADRRIGVRRWVFESRVLDAPLVLDVFESKASFVAHEVPLGLWIFPGSQPVDFVVVLIDLNAAARRATRTYAIGVLEPPDPFLVKEVLAAKGTDGAQVDDVAGEFVVAGGLWKDIDFLVRSPSDDLEFGRSADFSCEANAAGAHDTAVGKQSDLFSDVVLVLTLDFRLIESAVGLAVLVGVILQVALTGLIADRAIEWMIQKQQFEGHLLGGLHFGRIGPDDGPFFDRRLATRYEFGAHGDGPVGFGLADFDQAHAA